MTILTALLVGTALNSAALLDSADRLPLGSLRRNLSVAVMTAVHAGSVQVGLDRPRQIIDDLLGRTEVPLTAAAESPAPSTAPVTISDSSTTTTPTTMPHPPSSTSPGPRVDTTHRNPTRDEPVVVWVIGDSLVEMFGRGLINEAHHTGVFDIRVDFRFISGLSTPRFFDWQAYIERRIGEVQPEIVIALFGGNDGTPLEADGRTLQPETPEWYPVYALLVAETMDRLRRHGVESIYWVGLPIMRSAAFTERVKGLNSVYEAEAEARDWVTYISSFELFQNEDGEYATYLRDEQGRLHVMRGGDGAHFSAAGGERLARYVLGIIARDWPHEAFG